MWQCCWQVLKYYPARDIWKARFKGSALMANAAANVDQQGPVSANFQELLEGKNVEPDWLTLSLYGHPLGECMKVEGMFSHPLEKAVAGAVCSLERSIHHIRGVLIMSICEVLRQRLKAGHNGREAIDISPINTLLRHKWIRSCLTYL